MHFLCNTHSSISTSTTNHPNKHNIPLTRFSYTDLETATNGFSPHLLLGKGSHASVYRATLSTTTTTTIAIKKYNPSSMETASNELNILSKIHNHHIIKLIGYAIDSLQQNLLLVVEYMPNGSLYEHLHKHTTPPSFLTRVRYALQISKAIRTLHNSTPPVIHRDIKSSNVLIDGRGNAKIGDFGLAIKANVSDIRVMDTPPAGTLGYLDPCYLAPGDLSTKSDVFSLGILLLEIITGRKAIDVEFSPPCVVDWALPLIKSGSYRAILDRRIEGVIDFKVVRELCLVAATCVRSTAEKRPCVSEIVDCLKKVYMRVKLKSFSVWRWRVKRVERSRPLERNNKVSNVDKSAVVVTRDGKQGVRSRSKLTGFREILKVGPETETCGDKRRGQVTVKISSVRLSKSRSMSMLYSGKNGGEGKNSVRNPQVKELEVFPLLVKSSSRKIQCPKLLEG